MLSLQEGSFVRSLPRGSFPALNLLQVLWCSEKQRRERQWKNTRYRGWQRVREQAKHSGWYARPLGHPYPEALTYQTCWYAWLNLPPTTCLCPCRHDLLLFLPCFVLICCSHSMGLERSSRDRCFVSRVSVFAAFLRRVVWPCLVGSTSAVSGRLSLSVSLYVLLFSSLLSLPLPSSPLSWRECHLGVLK